MNKIVITISGGVLQSVHADYLNSLSTEVFIVDYDDIGEDGILNETEKNVIETGNRLY